MSNNNPLPLRDTHNRQSTRLFALFCVWLLAFGLFPAQAKEPSCPVDRSYVTYDSDTGKLHLPGVEVLDAAKQSQGVFDVELLAVETPKGTRFEIVNTAASHIPSAEVPLTLNLMCHLPSLQRT